MNEPSDRIYRNVINLLILFILMGITFYVLFYHQDYHQVWDLVQKASGEYLVLAAVLVFLFLCGEAWIIQLVLHPIVRYIPFFRCLKYTMVGFFLQRYHTVCQRWAASAGSVYEAGRDSDLRELRYYGAHYYTL